jgi:hypothetical protein
MFYISSESRDKIVTKWLQAILNLDGLRLDFDWSGREDLNLRTLSAT